MEQQFWHDRWETNDLGFHQDEFHPLLVRHWGNLNVASGGRVFVPLCGKSRDMAWLAEQGHDVLGVELSEIAVQSFFDEQRLSAARSEAGPFTSYKSDHIQIFCGDFFLLTTKLMTGLTGDISAVFDRASLIAMPADMRIKYVNKLKDLLLPGVQILLINLHYEEGRINPPPYRVHDDEVNALYEPWCDVELLEESETVVKGHVCAEFAYRLQVK